MADKNNENACHKGFQVLVRSNVQQKHRVSLSKPTKLGQQQGVSRQIFLNCLELIIASLNQHPLATIQNE